MIYSHLNSKYCFIIKMKSVLSYARIGLMITSIMLITYIFCFQCYMIFIEYFYKKEEEEVCIMSDLSYVIKVVLKCSLSFLAGALVTDTKYAKLGII